ncbi:gamma-mobile-trio protein GmtX [Marinobacter sp.]|uniref:gamma-mobile-trio protein GmtX n=1 Tax=Marinobacter sp. TaxID=50741 RepID=UPI00345BDA67
MLIPGQKSLLNSTIQHYRELTFAWERKPERVQTTLGTDYWVDDIADPLARMSVYILLSEEKALKAKQASKAQHGCVQTISNPSSTNKAIQNLEFGGSELNALRG